MTSSIAYVLEKADTWHDDPRQCAKTEDGIRCDQRISNTIRRTTIIPWTRCLRHLWLVGVEMLEQDEERL